MAINQDELEQLMARLLEMGGLAEEEVRLAVRGLVERNSPLIEQVIRGLNRLPGCSGQILCRFSCMCWFRF